MAVLPKYGTWLRDDSSKKNKNEARADENLKVMSASINKPEINPVLMRIKRKRRARKINLMTKKNKLKINPVPKKIKSTMIPTDPPSIIAIQ